MKQVMQADTQETKRGPGRPPKSPHDRIAEAAESIIESLDKAGASEAMRIVVHSCDMPVNDFKLMMQALVKQCRK